MSKFTGFVAMEYYWLILNRTFVIFVSAEGLYGWKAVGVVSSASPRFYETLQKVVEDPEVMEDEEGIKEFASRRGGFFIPRASITSAEFVKKRKWGMAGIRHSGMVYVRLVDGGSREFILLGKVDGEKIAREVLGNT
jgi:hypothetical protein